MKHFLILLLSLGTSFLSAQLIFPGDLNNDGQANYLDLLPLGVAFGQEGPPRINASLEWIPQENDPWSAQLPVSSINLGFVDSDGNGIIDGSDIEAIAFNYDSLQLLAIPPPMPYLLGDHFPTPVQPTLHIRFDPPVAMPGETVQMIVDYIVPPDFPLTASPLAIAFALQFPSGTIEEESEIIVSPNTDSGDLMFVWATNSQASALSFLDVGRIEFAASGRGDAALLQSRMPLFRASIVIEDMILFLETIYPDVLDPVLINTYEMTLDMIVDIDSFQLVDVPLIDDWSGIRVAPVPSRDQLYISTPDDGPVQLQIYSINGQLLEQEFYPSGKELEHDVSRLPAGVYILKLVLQAGHYVKKIMVSN